MREGILALLTVLAISGTAHAQALLYDPEPPKGSAYIRIANATSVPAHAELPGGVVDLGAGTADRIGSYQVMENVAGQHISVEIRAEGEARADLVLAPGSFTTLLLLPGGRSAAMVDETQFNQIRAKLSFYNATDCKVAKLTLGTNGPAIFEGVTAGTTRMRAVNPVEAQVIASCDGNNAAELALNGLEAGARYSIWYLASPKPIAFLTRDTTQAWKP